MQRQVDALTAAKERADAEAKRMKDGADAAAETARKRVAELEAQVQQVECDCGAEGACGGGVVAAAATTRY